MSPCIFFGNVIRKESNIFSKIWKHPKTFSRHCSARRAVLFLPGNDLNTLNLASELKLDCLVLDCEKSVAANQKDEARQNIRDLLDKGPVTATDPEWCIRVNPVQTPKLCEADIISLLSAKNMPVNVCLPKVKNINQLEWFTEKVWKTLLQRPEHDRGPIKLMMEIESARAMLNLSELCQKAEDLSTMAPLMPVALIFGNEELGYSIGTRKTQSGIELLYARQSFVLVARAFGLQAIDQAYVNFKNLEGLRESCKDGIILGYTGKQVSHIDQIAIIQDEFVPSRHKIHWAKTVVKAYRENQENIKEDLGFENSLIDNATLKQAQHVVAVAKAAGLKIESAHFEKDHEVL